MRTLSTKFVISTEAPRFMRPTIFVISTEAPRFMRPTIRHLDRSRALLRGAAERPLYFELL
jgi:hypothetical protein